MKTRSGMNITFILDASCSSGQQVTIVDAHEMFVFRYVLASLKCPGRNGNDIGIREVRELPGAVFVVSSCLEAWADSGAGFRKADSVRSALPSHYVPIPFPANTYLRHHTFPRTRVDITSSLNTSTLFHMTKRCVAIGTLYRFHTASFFSLDVRMYLRGSWR